MSETRLHRRDLLIATAATAAGLTAWTTSSALTAEEPAAAPAVERKRSLRLAHLTDVHVQPELRANDGMRSCLKHVQELADKPELILSGGDSIMDSFARDDSRTTLQWNLWRGALKEHCSLPVRACIGNHDIWGWSKSASHTTGEEPNWGKKRAIEMLQLPDRYYAFEQAGWKFVVLDSTQPKPGDPSAYTAHLDEPQFDWLSTALAATPATTPICVLSHIPILSAAALMWMSQNDGNFQLSGALMHTDAQKLQALFAKHPNVKLCLSGHLHLVDRADYNGVTYLCNGAVSGGWWKGPHKDCQNGYAVLDLYNDGSFERTYMNYGWKV